MAFAIVIGHACALAAPSPAKVFSDLAIIKAQCQQLAKLYVEKAVRGVTPRIDRRLARSLTGISAATTDSASWDALLSEAGHARPVQSSVKALIERASSTAAPDSKGMADIVASADRCSFEAEAAMKVLSGPAASGRAVTLVARALYLSQRVSRDAILLSTGVKVAGITADLMERERDELQATFQQLQQLPATPAIRSALEGSIAQWTLLQPKLNRSVLNKDSEDSIVRSSDVLVDALEELLEMVQKALLMMN
ncbi:hypothetical protein [Hydrogenophaga sp.]|uniref:hypothetical protein n=1 Tax=Hydrogenophaga sp. TaxID=1904254 RepID=UPI003D106D74